MLGLVADSERNILCSLSVTKHNSSIPKPGDEYTLKILVICSSAKLWVSKLNVSTLKVGQTVAIHRKIATKRVTNPSKLVDEGRKERRKVAVPLRERPPLNGRLPRSPTASRRGNVPVA